MEIPYIVNARKDTGLFNAKIAIWLFLASEVMLFGGFFSAYVFLRLGADYPWPERTLPVLPGLINTFVLIASSVTVVFAWAALKLRNWRQFQIYMWITVLCALLFMVLKGVEYNVKFHHQAVRLKDYTVLEGHLSYIGDTKVEKNLINLELKQGSTITFNNLRFHEAWANQIIAEAKAAGAKLELAAEVKGAEGFSDAGKSYFEKGAPLTVELLEKFAAAQVKARNHNQEIRSDALEAAWVVGKKQNPGKSDWEYSEKVSIDEAAIKPKLLTDIPAATFNVVAEKPFQISFKPRDVKEGPEQSKLRDETVINATLLASPMDFHYLDAIDFQYLVMKAKDKKIEPEVAIANSWLMQNDPFAREIWAWHLERNKKKQDDLNKLHGFKKDKKTGKVTEIPERTLTHKELYRIGWKEFAEYGEYKHKLKLSTKDKLKEEFMGPNYKARNPDEKESTAQNSHEEAAHGHDNHGRVTFPHLSVPREQIGFASKFAPAWNTYYAIYFTITGLHGLHVVGGAIVLAYYLFFGRRMYEENPEWLCNRVEVGGLFWHFVDLVWIFVFPILYLM